MAIITKLSAQKKAGRYNVFLDDQYAFSVSARTLAEFVLVSGKELTHEQLLEIEAFDHAAKASELAQRYLSFGMRTVQEVKNYLQQKQVDDQAADDAIKSLVELGLLDDAEYAKLFVKQDLTMGSDGPRSILAKLTKKGVDTELINHALAEVADQQWIEVGKRSVKTMATQLGKYSQKELERKMLTKLYNHGFTSELGQQVIASLQLVSDDRLQETALKQQGIKAFKRFKHKSEQERNYKIKQYLFQHGFSSDEINRFLAGEVIDLNELMQY